MREQNAISKVYTTDIDYELPDGTRKSTTIFGKYNENRARSYIETIEDSQVIIKQIIHHWNKYRMNVADFIQQADIIESDKEQSNE